MRHLLLVVLLTLCGCQPPVKDQPPFNPKDAVRVIEFDAGMRNCSATFVGSSTLLTASHCLRESDTLVSINGTVAGIVHVEHDGADHALVVVTTHAPVWAQVGPELLQGDDFEVYGNPINLRDQYRRGYVSGFQDERMLLDARLWLGDSGAALFKDGKVAGVVSGVYGHEIFYLGYALRLKFTPQQWATVQ